MSAFSDLLGSLIEQKNIKVFSMVKYCNLDRSTMYKIINGKRNPPSLEVLHKMSQFMCLTPTEYKKLEEAWEITKIGPETYYRRKSVEKFICQFPDRLTTKFSIPAPLSEITFDNGGAECIALTSRQHINYYVHQMLLAESGKSFGRIGLFLQADYHFLFNLLPSLQPIGNLQINHIMCISNEPTFSEDHQLLILKYLHEIFPLYMTNLDYTLLYYYDRIQSHYHNMNLFPCMILTSDSALLCTSDYQTGLFYKTKDIVNVLWNLYNSYQEKCTRIFRPSAFTPDSHETLLQTMFNSDFEESILYGIQPEPCLTPFFTGKLLREIFNYDLPNAESILLKAEQSFLKNREKIEKQQFFIYSTGDGLLQFLKTGHTNEIPEIFYHPLTITQRMEILQQVRQCCLNGTYRFLKQPLNHLPCNLHFTVFGQSGFMIFRKNNGQSAVLQITENRLINIFRDYLENMNPSSFYTAEECSASIDMALETLRTKQRID